MTTTETPTPGVAATRTKRRGFAALSPEQRREVAALGGKAAQAQGKAHRFTSEEARSAGQKGGRISRRNVRARAKQQSTVPEE